jgi:hypothetical protein
MNPHYPHAHPRYGFEFGSARVTRMAHIEGRYHVMAVDTPHRHVQVAVSPTGRSVRVWMDGVELGPDTDREATP